jgi:PAS domain S-box-containing protein
MNPIDVNRSLPFRISLKGLRSAWKRGLKIGYRSTVPGLLRGRIMLLNGLAIIVLISVVLFSAAYAAIGYKYFYGPLYIVPIVIAVLVLNRKGKFRASQNLYLVGSLLVISYWCYEGRGNGNEYTLIGLATTATLISEDRVSVIFANVMCAIIFIAYLVYHTQTPFVPDPAIDYTIVPAVILLNTVAVISFQIAFFRDLAKHYDEKLTVKYNELRKAETDLKANNEEIKAINEKLQDMTNQLEILVRQKSRELQTYIDAIDINMYSCINDKEGKFVRVNDQIVKASGYTVEELLGKHYSMLATAEHQAAHETERRAALLAGKVWRGEVEHRNRSGHLYWFDCVVIPIRNDHGQVELFLSLGLPITERKLHEQIQEKTRGILESIAFSASHNIRGPMARIKGLANLVEMDVFNRDEFKMVARKFATCSDELNTATSELVDFVHNHQELLLRVKPGKS